MYGREAGRAVEGWAERRELRLIRQLTGNQGLALRGRRTRKVSSNSIVNFYGIVLERCEEGWYNSASVHLQHTPLCMDIL